VRANIITKSEFMRYTTRIWNCLPGSVKRVGHPAPFPEELPIRFIQLYIFEDNVVLDLFCGSGTTCIDAVKTKKHYIGFDNNGEHVNFVRKRISNAIKALEENGERT
jgi:DNA modification methylase